MDQDEVARRGPTLILGFFTLMVGGLLALLGIMYDPVDTAAPVGGPLGPGAVDPTGGLGDLVAQSQGPAGSPGLFLAMAVAGVVLGGWSTYLFRGARGMVLLSTVVSLVCAYNLYGLLS